jgi:vitamin B12 transporter
MKRKFLLVTAVIISSHLYAQDSTKKTLDEVVVTATKTPIKQSQTGKVITVIDQATLQRNADKTLTEILNYQAGVYVNGANNVLGTNQEMYMRGAASGNTLILLDGIPVNDPSLINNSFDLNNINPAQVEKIEILKGAQSTLWGSDAVAGVINIITKKGGAKSITPSANIAYGSYHTFKAGAGLNGKVDKFSYNLNFNHTDSKGFSSAYDSTGGNTFDKDGFKQNNLQANLGYAFSPKLSITGMTNYGKYNSSLDGGAFKDDKDYTGVNTSFINSLTFVYKLKNASFHFSNTFVNTHRTISNDTTAAADNGDFYRADFKGKSYVSELFGNASLSSKLSLVAGVQRSAHNTSQTSNGYSRDFDYAYSSALGKDSAKTNNYALYASLMLLNVDGFNIEGGVRYNHHNIYGSNATFSFNPSYNIDENTRVFINVSSAYKVPSLYQLYSEYGNRDLQPEKSINYEAGVQFFGNDKKNSLRLVAFKRDIRQLIIFYSDPVTYASQYINRDKQNDYGFELESNIAVCKKANWVNNITWVDGKGNTGSEKVKNFYRRPNFTFNSTLTLQPVSQLTVSPSFRFVGSRLKGQYDAGPARMPQYYTLDFYAGYHLTKQINAFAEIRNITNQHYQDIVGYNSRGFNWMAGVSVAF